MAMAWGWQEAPWAEGQEPWECKTHLATAVWTSPRSLSFEITFPPLSNEEARLQDLSLEQKMISAHFL